MERKNKDRNPIFYKSAEEMDKPLTTLIEQLRIDISNIRGKLSDIKMSYGYDDEIETIQGGLTCMVSAMYNTKERFKKIEEEQKNQNHV